MNDQDMARELGQVRAALAECASCEQGFQVLLRTMSLHMRAAWLLIALARYDEAITEAHEANSARHAAWSTQPRHYGGAVLWKACEAIAVAHLARRQWREAEKAAHRALVDFGEHDGSLHVYRIARQAQGKPVSDQDLAARELAEFNARDYALRHIQP